VKIPVDYLAFPMLYCPYAIHETFTEEAGVSELEIIRSNAAKIGAAMDAIEPTVESYIRATGCRIDGFGLDAVGQADFVFNMRKGRNFRRSTIRHALDFIATGRKFVRSQK